MDNLFTASDKGQLVVKQEHVDPATAQHTLREIFRYRIKLTKTGILRYFLIWIGKIRFSKLFQGRI